MDPLAEAVVENAVQTIAQHVISSVYILRVGKVRDTIQSKAERDFYFEREHNAAFMKRI